MDYIQSWRELTDREMQQGYVERNANALELLSAFLLIVVSVGISMTALIHGFRFVINAMGGM